MSHSGRGQRVVHSYFITLLLKGECRWFANKCRDFLHICLRWPWVQLLALFSFIINYGLTVQTCCLYTSIAIVMCRCLVTRYTTIILTENKWLSTAANGNLLHCFTSHIVLPAPENYFLLMKFYFCMYTNVVFSKL